MILAEIVEARVVNYRDICVRRHSCLMGCERHCNTALSAPGKITYVIGKFEPVVESADAILDFATLYRDSETGQVPYKTWPSGVKGHFIARVPPLDLLS